MSIDTEQWGTDIGNFNRYSHYAIIKLNLFNIMASLSGRLVFLLVIMLQCISKVNTVFYFLMSLEFITSPAVSELTVDTFCLCPKFSYLIKGYLHYKTIPCHKVALDVQLIFLFEEKIIFHPQDIEIFMFL